MEKASPPFGWLVDALKESLGTTLPIVVHAFVADDAATRRRLASGTFDWYTLVSLAMSGGQPLDAGIQLGIATGIFDAISAISFVAGLGTQLGDGYTVSETSTPTQTVVMEVEILLEVQESAGGFTELEKQSAALEESLGSASADLTSVLASTPFSGAAACGCSSHDASTRTHGFQTDYPLRCWEAVSLKAVSLTWRLAVRSA